MATPMNLTKDRLVTALRGTTVVNELANASQYLEQAEDDGDRPPSERRPRTTTTSSDGVEWLRLGALEDLPDIEESRRESAEEKQQRVNGLMNRWRHAARRAKHFYADPWKHLHIKELETMRAKRYRYSAIRKNWTEDIVEIKMLLESFARGAMRECFRVKKMSTLSRSDDWTLAGNYVAKRYIQEVDRQVLFDDVRLQMDAKLWAEEYNRHDPPKKIDIVMMCVLECFDLPGSPLFHLEHFIEGDYVKYNSNSGFVSEVARKTPHAFSHFTFERSGHQMIVVDIQGVGDLYTDPQIHTVVGTDYGDGNLGTRGMALFFHSHKCNDICHSLCLTEFDLSEGEQRAIEDGQASFICNAETRFERSSQCSAVVPDLQSNDAMEGLRQRTLSMLSRTTSTSESESRKSGDHDEDCVCEKCLESVIKDSGVSADDFVDDDDSKHPVIRFQTGDDENDKQDDEDEEEVKPRPLVQRKVALSTLEVTRDNGAVHRSRDRHSSMGSVGSLSSGSVGGSGSYGSSSRLTRDTEREEFWNLQRKKSIPAGLLSPEQLQHLVEEAKISHQTSVLGQIHLDMARYHELGRFLAESEKQEKEGVENGTTTNSVKREVADAAVNYDKEAALYHLDVARRCGVLEAIITVAQMAYGLPHELLKDVGHEENWCDDGEHLDGDQEAFGFELMETAAEMGDRVAMLFIAEAYETGRRMGRGGQASFPKAIEWYEKCMGFQEEEEDEGVSSDQTCAKPRYELLAKVAEMYKDGGYGLQQDYQRAYNLYTEAAECAMEAMKGKLANKFYELAEMCDC